MFSHFLRISIRHFRKSPLFSFINIFGLATSMAICLLISLFVYHELNHDRFHENAENIYRVNTLINMQGQHRTLPVSSPAVGPDLAAELPEVKNSVRISAYSPINIKQGEDFLKIKKAIFADSTFFDLFSFRLLRGDAHSALKQPYSIVLTRSFAQKLFPDQDPMGQLIYLDSDDKPLIVTGISNDYQVNSHIHFDVIVSLSTVINSNSTNVNSWDGNIGYYTYLLMDENTSMDVLLEKSRKMAYDKVNYKFEGMNIEFGLSYFPLNDIRLHSNLDYELEETGTISKVWLFSAVALFVLFIAGFNYVNLTVAHAGKRAREIGIYKVLGAHNKILTRQFLFETLLVTSLSFLAALLIVEISLPVFNYMLNTRLLLTDIPWWMFIFMILIFIGVFGTLANLYPSLYMSSFQPVKILKGEFYPRIKGFRMGNLLLLLQFIISLSLIVCTMVIFLQIRYFGTKDYGFKKDKIIAVKFKKQDDARLFISTLKKHPWNTSSCITTSFPGETPYMEGVSPEESERLMVQRLWTDPDYFNTLGISIDKGEFFTREDGLEEHKAIVNQSFINKTGWVDPLGKKIERDGITYTVIGVVKDFHSRSLHHEVEPLFINVLSDISHESLRNFWVLLKYNASMDGEVLESINREWKLIFPEKSITYHFVSDLMSTSYEKERIFGYLFVSFTLLAIVIAMLGILGLSSFAARQRLKEIGIRKVLGASTSSVMVNMSVEFLKWIIISAVIAFPLSYWLMERWLSGFAFSIDFPFYTFPLALLVLLTISFSIIISQSFSATRVNPVQVLKNE